MVWEQTYDESYYTYHVHESLPGLLLVMLRITLAVLFGFNLRNTIAVERSVLRKDFYQSFAFVSLINTSIPYFHLLASFPFCHLHYAKKAGDEAIHLASTLELYPSLVPSLRGVERLGTRLST